MQSYSAFLVCLGESPTHAAVVKPQEQGMQVPVRSRGTKVIPIITVVSVMIAKNSKGQYLQIQFRIDILTLSAPVSPIFLFFLLFSVSS